MAKIVGSREILGTVGRLRHYRLPGVEGVVVAECGGATKEQIKNNPTFARTRENNAKFSGVAKMSKQVKLALGSWALCVSNKYLISKLNKINMAILQKNLEEEMGKESIFLSKWRADLNNITYYYYKPLGEIMRCHYTFEIAPDRKSITVRLPGFSPKEQIKSPARATHFQLCLSLGVVCDMIYTDYDDHYQLKYWGTELQRGYNALESEWFSVAAGPMGDLTLQVSLPEELVLKEDMTVLPVFGLIFGQMTNKVNILKRESGSLEMLGAV